MKKFTSLFTAVICTSLSFASFAQSEIPLVDENGNFIIITNEDGTPSFVYPDPIETPTKSGFPLVDDNGDCIIVMDNNGVPSFVYPDQKKE